MRTYSAYFAELRAAVKTDLGLESQSPPKWPFLTVFSKTYDPTKIDVLGTLKDSILFQMPHSYFFLSTGVP